MYEKVKVSYVNVFYTQELSKEQLQEIEQQVNVRIQEMQQEMQAAEAAGKAAPAIKAIASE